MVQIQTSRKSPFIAETFIHFSKAHVCDAKSSGNLGRHFAIRSEACRQRDSTLPLEINMEVVFFCLYVGQTISNNHKPSPQSP